MRIRIDSPLARLTVDLQEDQVAALLRTALDYASGGTGKAYQTEAPSKPVPNTPKYTAPKSNEHKPAAEAGYKGFLYVKCESCGKTKGFCVKTPIKKHRCECGHETMLENMKPLYVKCKCGESFDYQTNLTDDTIPMNCIKCGSPVDLEFHSKKNAYYTIE